MHDSNGNCMKLAAAGLTKNTLLPVLQIWFSLHVSRRRRRRRLDVKVNEGYSRQCGYSAWPA